jgi:hypothetical protein
MVNPQYNQLMESGAFPNQIDPWAEKGEHFHPIHGQMISILLQVLRKPLRDLGVNRVCKLRHISRHCRMFSLNRRNKNVVNI